jgi:hypothetical protein
VIVVAESNRRRVSETDDLRHYRFPWMLLATVEAVPRGNALERARALIWLEEALHHPIVPADFAAEVWVMAEVLLALRAVEARLEGRVFEPAPAGPTHGAGRTASPQQP